MSSTPTEVAGILISIVALRGAVFSKISGCVGMLAFGLMFVFEISSSFVPALFKAAMIFAAGGGLLSMAWYVLVGHRLLRLAWPT